MRTGAFKPFYYRLPMRVRVWNLRREQRERWEFHRFTAVKYDKKRKRPWVARLATRRAWKMRNWGKLFDPEIPF